MITGDYDRLNDLARYNVCAEHKTHLEVAWYQKQWTLRCGGGGGHYPDAITRQLSLIQEYKAGEELPSFIEDNIIKAQRRRAMTQGKQDQTTKLSLVPQVDLGTGELLLPELVQAIVDYARKYDLDPERGHVILMYGKPYVTIDGYLYHAKQGARPYSLRSRPMEEKEREPFRLGAEDHAWVTELEFTDTGSSFTGIGIVTQEEMTAPSKGKPEQLKSPVVATHPWQMAQKRAEWQALRRAFPIGETPGGDAE
ncbi:hypothetical protein ES708_29558 [subsurface metagenome]